MLLKEYLDKYENMSTEEREEQFEKDFPTGCVDFPHYKHDKLFSEVADDEIIYIPEGALEDLPECVGDVYTKQDFINLCNGCVELAEYVYESLSWQYPSTYLEELCNNYTDVVIDYKADRIHANSVNETLWDMLNKEEQEQVLAECK